MGLRKIDEIRQLKPASGNWQQVATSGNIHYKTYI